MKQILFILIFLFSLRTEAEPDQAWMVQTRHPFAIHYTAQDSGLVVRLFPILQPAWDELLPDLQMADTTTYHIVIAPARAFYQNYLKQGLPKWSGAFAVPSLQTLVIKSPHWDRPENDISKSLIHEVVHLLLFVRCGRQPVPRWLDEGLALFYEKPTQWDYPQTLSRALFTRSLLPLQDIEHVLSFQQSKASLAYQESYSVVTYFLSVYDSDGLHILLNGFRRRQSLDDLFQQATGSRFVQFEIEWQNHIAAKYRYSWLTEWDLLLWLFIVLLAVVAVLWIRRRNRRTLAAWDRLPEEPLPIEPQNPPEPPPDEMFIEKNDQVP
jgi:hypothetical protein